MQSQQRPALYSTDQNSQAKVFIGKPIPRPNRLLSKDTLSRAYRWQKLLDDGVYGSITEMADKERINPLCVPKIRFGVDAGNGPRKIAT